MKKAPRHKIEVCDRPVRTLQPRPGNPRAHSRGQIRQIAKSIEQFGFNNPVLIDKDGLIVAGHGRLEAAKLLGLSVIPTIRLDHMTEAQVRAYVIADNRLAERSGWDRDLLAKEFEYLTTLQLDFDVTTTGFGTGEIDVLLGQGAADEADGADEVPAPGPEKAAVTRQGDLWELGDHRLLCGDATDPVAFAKLLGRRRAQAVFTDPPYNVAIDGNVCGSGAIRHREFAMASGEMSPEQFSGFLADVLGLMSGVCSDGAIMFVCMDWRHTWELTSASRKLALDLKNLVIWRKDNAGMGSMYRSQHELIFVFKTGQRSHINNVELGRFGRHRTNVWEYPGANSLRKNRRRDLEMHPTVKPVALVADAICDCTNRDGIVLDCFAGSGTTLIAAHKTGRRAYLIELDPIYCDVIVRRYERFTGQTAVLANDGRTFAGLAEARLANTDVAMSKRRREAR